ncbi:porin [Aquitalea sp. LB_tupeE]|nr:porin [Aquitalea sp. LB_tupeE]
MHKKSLAALVATLFAVPFAAHADVTIYGFLSAGFESASATGGSTPYASRARVVDNNSRIGFKGFEDLGNGTKAIWQVEQSLKNFEQGGTTDAGVTATFATRNSFVGLDNADLGKVYAGYSDSAYKTLTAAGINLFQDYTAENNGSGTGVYSRGEARLKNSIHYVSPTWSGLQFGASYGVDEAKTATANKSRVSLAGNYTNGGLIVAVGFDRQNDTSTSSTGATTFTYAASGSTASSVATSNSGQNTTYTKLAASYKFATGTLIGAGYEFGRFGSSSIGSNLKQDDWTVSLSQDYGPFVFKLEYSQLGQLKGSATPDDYKAKEYTVGIDYNLSKSTKVYTYYAKINNNTKQNANFYNNSIYSTSYSSSTNTAAALAAGDDPKAFGVGLKVAF